VAQVGAGGHRREDRGPPVAKIVATCVLYDHTFIVFAEGFIFRTWMGGKGGDSCATCINNSFHMCKADMSTHVALMGFTYIYLFILPLGLVIPFPPIHPTCVGTNKYQVAQSLRS
jgi:hypothetical protein